MPCAAFPVQNTTTSCAPPPPPPPDTTAPVVSLTSPTDGSTIHGTVPLSADASDEAGGSGVNEVRVFLAGGIGIPFVTFSAPPYTLNWNTMLLANGSHTLRAEAEDNAGNIGQSADVVVTVPEPAFASMLGVGSLVVGLLGRAGRRRVGRPETQDYRGRVRPSAPIVGT